MNLNKYLILGIILIIFGIIIFFTDTFNVVIRPITYLFLMGSSKGKDIVFFFLFGLFILLSQLYKLDLLEKYFNFKNNKILKMSILLSTVILVLGIFLEILLRYYLNIKYNTIFVSMKPSFTTTSILHSHIYKSIFGNLISLILGTKIPTGINVGNSLSQYVPPIAYLFILLLPIIFILQILSLQKRLFASTICLSFFSSTLIIGILDGGLFGTPAIVGLCGLIFVYEFGHYLDYYFEKNIGNKENIKLLKLEKEKNKRKFNKTIVFIFIILILVLRISITFTGANGEYYELDIVNPTDNIELNNFSIIKVQEKPNEKIIYLSSEYNEMELLNSLKEPLKNKCDYYTLSWNGYSYFQ